jgi:hypothetical protein
MHAKPDTQALFEGAKMKKTVLPLCIRARSSSLHEPLIE